MPVFSSVLSDSKGPLYTQTLRTHPKVLYVIRSISISIACAPFDAATQRCYDRNAGWSSLVARWAHNPKVGGSNPPPATNLFNQLRFRLQAHPLIFRSYGQQLLNFQTKRH